MCLSPYLTAKLYGICASGISKTDLQVLERQRLARSDAEGIFVTLSDQEHISYIQPTIDLTMDKMLLLDYARSNGLCHNYRAPDLYPYNTPPTWDTHAVTGNTHLPNFRLETAVNLDERLALTKEAARLLCCIAQDSDDFTKLPKPRGQGRSNPKNNILRLERPLLSNQQTIDLSKLYKRDHYVPDLKNINFPLELVDEDQKEGVSLASFCSELIRSLTEERFKVTEATFRTLQTFLSSSPEQDKPQPLKYALWHDRVRPA